MVQYIPSTVTVEFLQSFTNILASKIYFCTNCNIQQQICFNQRILQWLCICNRYFVIIRFQWQYKFMATTPKTKKYEYTIILAQLFNWVIQYMECLGIRQIIQGFMVPICSSFLYHQTNISIPIYTTTNYQQAQPFHVLLHLQPPKESMLLVAEMLLI